MVGFKPEAAAGFGGESPVHGDERLSGATDADRRRCRALLCSSHSGAEPEVLNCPGFEGGFSCGDLVDLEVEAAAAALGGEMALCSGERLCGVTDAVMRRC